ncbi:hypothetical protein MHY20_10515 [Helcobacillus sp. ACRRO]|uniref:hypothetical protein n=1 Tax=Helcobacillus sp. ACRRO TaxID=2918202 RepID=UPI001EF3E97C|nr:hypothetical protein [Helcobacillus sp. ACRRO]MCG7428028.1 hypothetical protein [Helcobacillus sp. ACRRO]
MSSDSGATVRPLDWYAKPFTQGDIDGSSSDRMLGKSNLSSLELLIRETAQNSWDARRRNSRPLYGVRARFLGFNLRRKLGVLFRDYPDQELSRLLNRGDFEALEIYDRGTTGLDGPTDLRPVRKGESANYQNMISKLGVARDNTSTGGTYGFGKTAAFRYSRVGTVIFWTRIRLAFGQYEHRLIATAFKDSYSRDGTQYTGRHWWGIRSDQSALPLTGVEAEKLGNMLFERGFTEYETGTSMLILAPDYPSAEQLDDDDCSIEEPPDLEALIASAIRRHLWPKLITPPGESSPPMTIEAFFDGEEIALDLGDDDALRLWGYGLNSIRSERSGGTARFARPRSARVRLHDVRYTRNRMGIIGHLAIVTWDPEVLELEDWDDLNPYAEHGGLDAVALMRGQAELVVATENWGAGIIPKGGLHWLAVYKAAESADPVYARAEPPAHDAWVQNAADNDVRLLVRFTQRKVQEALKNTLAPQAVEEPGGTQTQLTTGTLSHRLTTILPPAPILDPRASTPSRRGPGSSPKKRSAAVRILDQGPIGADEFGRPRIRVRFRVDGTDRDTRVKFKASLVGSDGVTEALSLRHLKPTWYRNALPDDQSVAIVPPATDWFVEFTGESRRAVRADLTPEVRHGEH